MTAIGRGTVLATVLALSLALSACVSDAPDKVPGDESSPGPASPDTSESDPSPPPDTLTAPSPVPIELECVELLPLQALYDYNPNIGTSPSTLLSPLTERVLGYDGLACGWSNQSSGERITAAVARFSARDLETISESAEAGPGAQALPGSNGFFWRDASMGTIEAFSGEYWIVIESPTFIEMADAVPLLDAIEESLP